MLNIRFTAHLTKTRPSQGDINTSIFLTNTSSTAATSNAHRRLQTTFAFHQQGSSHEGTSNDQKKADTQKHAYNTISESWNVRRTSLNHFPPETQRHIRENKRGEKPNTARKSGPLKSAVQPPSSPLHSSIAKTLQVLAYESKAGYNNFRGKSGEHFTEWMDNTLRVLSSELTAAGYGSMAQQCEILNTRYIAGYEAALGGLKERQTAVSEMTAALKTLDKQLESAQFENVQPQQVKQTAATLSSSSISTVDIDAEAAEAHEEETATPTIAPNATNLPENNDISSSSGAGVGQPDEVITPTTETLQDGYVMIGNRKVKATTVAFRQSFAQAAAIQQAAAAASSSTPLSEILSNGEQRTSQWLSLRERRLTASAFSKALGFFPGDRESLWEEKVGLKTPFAGNEATSWGTRMEPEALSTYEALTGQRVESCMFRVKHDDPPHGWLGASPDGLVQGLEIRTTSSTTENTNSSTGGSNLILPNNTSSSSSSSLGQGPGILEIKCPYNKGRPDLAVPPRQAIWYYMPQLQGLMDIFDRHWCSLFIWTQHHGSAAFQVKRNEEYWAAAFEILAEFWWGHVVPARQAYDAGATREEIEAFRPVDQIEAAELMRRWSKSLAAEAPGTFYSAGGNIDSKAAAMISGGSRGGPARRY